MKYQGMREGYCVLAAVLLSVFTVAFLIRSCISWKNSDNAVRVCLLILFCILIAGFWFVISLLRHPSCYAEFRADGIHVFSKEAGELAFLDWNDAREHRLVTPDLGAPRFSYDLLILQRAAPFGDQTISMLRKYRMADIGKIAPYRLDEQMQKLREGTMTAEEFQHLPYLFLVADQEYDKKGYLFPSRKVETLWRARRMECRAAEDGPEDGP